MVYDDDSDDSDGDNVEMVFWKLIIIFCINVGIHLYPSLAS